MNKKQRETLSAFFSDLSKGLIIASAVGISTQKMGWLAALIYLIFAFYSLIGSLYIDGDK